MDDNPEILENLKFTLEMNDYEVCTAENGEEALTLMKQLEFPPDLIISDILMPGMNGYEFFDEISSHPDWSIIPFIFLTAKSSPEEIRQGKLLGVDDYITKPFSSKDLLASIKGKLLRKDMATSISQKFEGLMQAEEKLEANRNSPKKRQIRVFIVEWDDDLGPVLKEYIPSQDKEPFDLNDVTTKLFHSMVLIYGQQNITSPEGVLLRLERIQRSGYVFFDAYKSAKQRAGQKKYMIGVIAPEISYFDSLQIKREAANLSSKIKNNQSFELRNFWDKITQLFS